MATVAYRYKHLPQLVAEGTLDLVSGTFKVALVTSGYLFSNTHTQWADASANEISGAGYTAGGQTLANVAGAMDDTTWKMTAAPTTWTGLSATFRAAIVYKQGTFGGLTDPVLLYVLFDDTPADVTVSGTDFTISWSANGLVRIG